MNNLLTVIANLLRFIDTMKAESENLGRAADDLKEANDSMQKQIHALETETRERAHHAEELKEIVQRARDANHETVNQLRAKCLIIAEQDKTIEELREGYSQKCMIIETLRKGGE